MKIGFLVNDVTTEQVGFTTTRLGCEAVNQGHEVFVFGLAEAVVTDEALRLAEITRPKLVQDGMFLVGLDVVGDKLMEINVFSPGGLGSAQKLTKVNFCRVVIEALQRKVDYMKFYGRNFGNVEMSSL